MNRKTASQNLQPATISLYHIWIDLWLSSEPAAEPYDECLKVTKEIAPQWLQNQLSTTTIDKEALQTIVACYKKAALARLIPLGGRVPPSSAEWDVLSGSYDPRVSCSCRGIYPVPPEFDPLQLEMHECKAIRSMVKAGHLAIQNEKEWNNTHLFSARKLRAAISELILSNGDEQCIPSSCATRQYNHLRLPEVRAPDRRPAGVSDLDDTVHHRLYPTKEGIRLCADAKHFFVVSSGASLVDPGILCAIADSGNDILIGDYCEAADNETMRTLQQVGAAAMAFLKICTLAGIISSWHFDILVAATVQFRILGYYRDHSTPRRPGGAYGSRMTGLTMHRHIDLGLAVGVVASSLATGERITEHEFMQLMETCTLINDLVDFRGDTMRKQRENVVLRGIRGSICQYLDGLISQCIRGTCTLIQNRKINALVIMSLCNWGLLACHHKVYELLCGTRLRSNEGVCHYHSTTDGSYEQLLNVLEKYGTLGNEGPRTTIKRKSLQVLYNRHKLSSANHMAWLADATREMLNPTSLRRLVDFVHYEWDGQIGDAHYCP